MLIENLYNDRVTNVVSEDMFKRFVAKYEQERVERIMSVETLEKRIASIRESSDNAGTWVRLIKKYSRLETLNSETLLLLIDKIIVGESEFVGKQRICDVKIIYNYVGDVDSLALEDSGDIKAVSA